MPHTRPTTNLARDLVEAEKSSIKAPTKSTRLQRKTWRHILENNPHLNDEAYREQLTLYVWSYANFIEWSADLDQQGPLVEGPHGNPVPNPLAALVKSAAMTCSNLSAKLGLTVAAKHQDIPKNKQKSAAAPPKDTKPQRGGAPALRLA